MLHIDHEDDINADEDEFQQTYNLITKEFIIEICMLLIFPIPYYDLYIKYEIGKDTIVYLLSEFLLAFMFVRVYFLVRSFMNYSQYMDSYAKELCKSYGFQSDVIFTLKSQIVLNPEVTVLYLFFGTVVISAYIVRILEVPYFRTQDSEFDSYFTAVWWTVVTLTTIGYGDISPCTPPGQMFAMALAFWGALLVSLLVVACSSIFQLSSKQDIAVSHVKMTRTAAEVITKGFRYFMAKKKARLFQLKLGRINPEEDFFISIYNE